MNRKRNEKRLGLVAGASVMLAALPQAQAAGNPFELSSADGASILVAESGEQKGISVLEGKCGTGKCGTERIREMMDKNADGSIDRDEYISWSSAVAEREFDKFSKGKSSVEPDDVYEHYQSLEFHRQG